jgi:F-type H+-transporting ATPase subunit b
MLHIVTPAFAQEDDGEHAPPADAHAAGTEAHAEAEHHGVFPPFDPATFGSQLVWLAITFGVLLLLMSRVALPRIGGILEARSARIAGDLAEAGRLKEETDAAIAAYEQALAEARQNAHAIGQRGRDATKVEIDAERQRLEAGLQQRLEAAEARIGEVKVAALREVDAIARDATAAIVETLAGGAVADAEIRGAVERAMTERS